jgi:hypothetical protein
MSNTSLSDRAFGLSIRTEAAKFPRRKNFKVVLRVGIRFAEISLRRAVLPAAFSPVEGAQNQHYLIRCLHSPPKILF